MKALVRDLLLTLLTVLWAAIAQGFHALTEGSASVIPGNLILCSIFFFPLWFELIRKRSPFEQYGFRMDRSIVLNTVLLGVVMPLISLVVIFIFGLAGETQGSMHPWILDFGAFSPLVAVFVLFPQTLYEELIFRGFIQFKINALTHRRWPGIAVQSILFVLVHGIIFPSAATGELLTDPRIIVIMVSIVLPNSLLFGMADERARSIVPSWIMHGIGLVVSTISGYGINFLAL
jgi:membrane protease YdiL (CAAX protease family)